MIIRTHLYGELLWSDSKARGAPAPGAPLALLSLHSIGSAPAAGALSMPMALLYCKCIPQYYV